MVAPCAVTGDTRVVGVFGWPVAHSLSPAMHNAAFASLGLPFVYVPFSVAPESLSIALRGLPALGVTGVNLTIPHKVAAVGLVDDLTATAREIGAVNTVTIANERLIGDNTDGIGFTSPLNALGIDWNGAPSVVVGAGGAARTALYELRRLGAHITLVNRSEARAIALARSVDAGLAGRPISVLSLGDVSQLERTVAESRLIVNTTPVGMYPEAGELPPIPVEAFRAGTVVYDLIYRPAETLLLRQARQAGCKTVNGVQMLVRQGAAAFQIWTGVEAPLHVMEEAVLDQLAA